MRIFFPPPFQISAGSIDNENAKKYGWGFSPNEQVAFINPDTSEVSFITTNSRGWKDIDHSYEKPEGVVRILFLGDSFTWGIVEMEDLYSRHVQKIFTDKGFDNVEVISLGVGAFGLDQILEMLLQEGLLYEPDFIIYQFSSNDVTDNLLPDDTISKYPIHYSKLFKYVIDDNGQVIKKTLTPVDIGGKGYTSTFKRIVLKSALFYNLTKVVISTINKKKNVTMDESFSSKFDLENIEVLSETEVKRRAWKIFDHLFSEMSQIVEDNSAQFLVFSPNGDEGSRNFFKHWNMFSTDDSGDFIFQDGVRYDIDWSSSSRKVEQLTIDTGGTFITTKRPYNRYTYDPHPNADGNLAMAQDITDFLLTWEPFNDSVGN